LICRVYIAWSQNFVLPAVTEEARVWLSVDRPEEGGGWWGDGEGQHGVVHLWRPGTAREEARRRARVFTTTTGYISFYFAIFVHFVPRFLRTAVVCYTFHIGYITAVVASILFIIVRSIAVLEPRL